MVSSFFKKLVQDSGNNLSILGAIDQNSYEAVSQDEMGEITGKRLIVNGMVLMDWRFPNGIDIIITIKVRTTFYRSRRGGSQRAGMSRF